MIACPQSPSAAAFRLVMRAQPQFGWGFLFRARGGMARRYTVVPPRRHRQHLTSIWRFYLLYALVVIFSSVAALFGYAIWAARWAARAFAPCNSTREKWHFGGIKPSPHRYTRAFRFRH